MMQSSQLDTASPDQDGSRSQTRRNTTNILHPTRVYDCHNWTLQVRTRTDLVHKRQETRQTFFIQQESMTRCKLATVEQLQLSVLKRGKKASALTNKKHCICPVEKTFRTFFENRGGDIFFNKWATIYMC